MAEHDVGNNTYAEDSGASSIENYGATTQGTEPTSTSAQNENTALLQINAEDETAITATTGISSLLSNTSADSHYFQRNNEFRPGPRKPGHTHSDSLDYSITSSTNSLYLPTPTNQEDRTNGTYVGFIERSLRNQHQPFPSSMFPGQKLISPTNEKEVTDIPEDTPAYTSSYYYFPSSPHKDGSSTTYSSNLRSVPLPPSYQKVRSNVYQKRLNPGFCPVDGDLEFCGTTDDKNLVSSWTKCSRCFFSPRVLLTLVICGVIIFNLLRMGEQHRYYYQRSALTNKNNQNSSVRGQTTTTSSNAEYVKLRVIGTTSDSNNP